MNLSSARRVVIAAHRRRTGIPGRGRSELRVGFGETTQCFHLMVVVGGLSQGGRMRVNHRSESVTRSEQKVSATSPVANHVVSFDDVTYHAGDLTRKRPIKGSKVQMYGTCCSLLSSVEPQLFYSMT